MGINSVLTANGWDVSGPVDTSEGENPRRYQNKATIYLQQRTAAGGALSNRTYHSITRAPVSEFVMARLVIKNMETATIDVDAAAMAVTNTAASDVEKTTPSVGNTLTGDSSTGWVRATFSGANSVTLPARLGANRPSLTFSDWMPMQSIVAVDGSPRPYIMGRVYVPGSAFSYNGLNSASWNVPDAGIYWYSYTQAIAGSSAGTPLGITTPSSFTSTSKDSNSTVAGFEFITPNRCLTIATAGNSITQGQSNATDQVDSCYAYAIQSLRAVGYPVSHVNLGWSGQTSSAYVQHGYDQLTAFQPDYCFYSVYTPNEALSAAVVNAMFARAMSFAQYCVQNSVTPVFAFLAPNNSLDATDDALLIGLMDRCKAAGFLVMDITSSVSDGATPRRWATGTNYDSLHPATAGKVLMGAAIAAWIRNNLHFPLNV